MEVKINSETKIIEIEGIKYAFELFEALGKNGVPEDTLLKLKRGNGCITLVRYDGGGLVSCMTD